MKELIYHRLLLPAVAANADRPCATNAGTGVGTTFAEHLHNVSTTIGGLQSLGVGRGDRFAVMTLNSVEYLELYHAAFLGGGVVNPLNLRFAPKELAYVLRDSGTKVCFVDAIFANLIDSVKSTWCWWAAATCPTRSGTPICSPRPTPSSPTKAKRPIRSC